jgi:MFS family permease
MTQATPSVSADINPESQKRAVLLVSAFAAFLVPFLTSAINLALPSIGRDMHANAVPLSWVVSSSLLASAIFMLPFGRLGDITGRKRIFLLGIILFTISTLLIVFSHSLASLIALRTLQGFSSAMIFGTSLAILTAVFPAGERGKAMGISVTATYTGLSVGPVVGGILTHSPGWRSIFVLLFLIGLICIYLVLTKMKSEWADARGEKFDWKGSLVYGVSLFALMYGFSRLPSVTGWILVSSGVVTAALFLFLESKTDNPVFDARLFLTNRVLAFSGLAALINYSATSAIGFFMSLYLQNVKGLDSRSAGLIMISQPLVMALLSPLAGKLSDIKNPGIIASTGMGITGVGLILLCFINATTPLWIIVFMLALMGAGFALFSSPNSNAIMSSVEKRYLGIASGLVGTMRMIGQMMSMGIAMMLISLYIGKQAISSSTASGLMASMKTGFIVFSVLSVIGVFASLARNKRPQNSI